MGQTEYVTEPGQLQHLLTSAEIEVSSVLPINQEVLCVRWHFIEEAVQPSSMTNVVVAAFTTAQARLKLFECLHALGPRAWYYDTDSIIYVSIPGDSELTVGSTLGDLADELAEHGPGTFISRFVSSGPKFYAFEFRKHDGSKGYVCKLKGLRLHYRNAQKINFESIRKMILEDSEPIEVNKSAIRRTAFRDVLTLTERKKCKPVYDKRRYVALDRSYPYGFKSMD